MTIDVTVVTGTFPSRADLLEECKASVAKQVHRVAEQIIVNDEDRTLGCWGTRNEGMMLVETEWTAFLDDDDLFLPHHIQFLADRAAEFDLDMVVPWFKVQGGTDPFPQHRKKKTWNPDAFHCFPIPVLVRTEFLHNAFHAMGGFASGSVANTGSWEEQDLPVWLHVIRDQGAKFGQFPDITWIWRHNGRNSSGLTNRGR